MRTLLRLALTAAPLLAAPAALAQTYALDRVVPANGMGRYLQASFYDPAADNVAIVDFSGAFVHRYRLDGTFVGAAAISPPIPTGVDGAALAPGGAVAILVNQSCEVFEVSPATLAVTARRALTGSGSIAAPSVCAGIDVGSDGALYVSSHGNNFVYVYPRAGTEPTRRFATPFAADNLARIPGTSQLVLASNAGDLAIYNEDGTVASASSRLGGAVWRGAFTRAEIDGATFVPTTGQLFFCHHALPIDNCYLLSRTCETDAQCPSPYFAACDGGQCVRATCGDGRREGAEACDDGNARDGDGCSAACAVEADFRCAEPAVSLRNGSFEAPAITTAFANATPADWTLAAGSVDIHREGLDPAQGLAPVGAQLVDLNGPSPGRIHQDVATTAGARYHLRFQLAYNSACATEATMRVAALDGATSLANATAAARHRFVDPVWSTQTLAFQAAGATTRVQFEGLTPGGACGASIDAVSVAGASACAPVDTDSDGLPDAVERRLMLDPMRADTDGDGVSDGTEVPDPAMPRDTDGDTVIDARDEDDDGDGVATRDELGAGGATTPRNTDATVPAGEGTSDAAPDYLDDDDDGDGIPTRVEGTLEGATPGDTDAVPAWLDRDSDGDGVPDAVERGADGMAPANSDMGGAGDRPDFLDADSDNDCLADGDAREAGAARTDGARPSATADANCTGAASVCDVTRGVCVAPPPPDASPDVPVDAVADAAPDLPAPDASPDVAAVDGSPDVAEDAASDAVIDAVADASPDVAPMDAAVADDAVVDAAKDASPDAGADVGADAADESPTMVYQGGGCGCDVPGASSSRGTSLVALAALAAVLRRRRARSA